LLAFFVFGLCVYAIAVAIAIALVSEWLERGRMALVVVRCVSALVVVASYHTYFGCCKLRYIR